MKVKELINSIDSDGVNDELIQIIRFDEDFDCYDEVSTNSNYLDVIGDLDIISLTAIGEDTFRIEVDWKQFETKGREIERLNKHIDNLNNSIDNLNKTIDIRNKTIDTLKQDAFKYLKAFDKACELLDDLSLDGTLLCPMEFIGECHCGDVDCVGHINLKWRSAMLYKVENENE